MKNRFPYYDESVFFEFPPLETARPDGLLAAGGNLSPGMLLSAYKQGIFPWFSEEDPVLWWSPDPRYVLFPEKLHIPGSLKKVFNKNLFNVTFNTRFDEIIEECRKMPRPGQNGTWITEDLKKAYIKLYELGFISCAAVTEKKEKMGRAECAAQAEKTEQVGRAVQLEQAEKTRHAKQPVYAEQPEQGAEKLVGGVYGVKIGKCFFGESMFAKANNASKYGFVKFVDYLKQEGVVIIDCQIKTSHLERFGAEMIPRRQFLEIIKKYQHI